MQNKHLIFIGIIIANILIFVATLNYAGGSLIDKHAIGYDWANNYISHLINPLALNGEENPSRPWAMGGVLFLSASFGLFFYDFSKKINVKSASNVIKFVGVGMSLLSFLVVFPKLHDIMVTITTIFTLFTFFYVTVFVAKSRLHFLKWFSILSLVFHYLICYLFFSHTLLEHMPILQKMLHMNQMIWVLCLAFFSKNTDFEHIKK